VGEEQTNDAVDAEQLAQRYRALVEHTPDGICVHEHGVIVYVNHATARLLGARTADDLVGRPLTDFVHPESVPGMLERIGKLTTAGADVTRYESGFRVRCERRPQAVDMVTLPYPGLATDLLPMAVGFAAVADGVSLITENVFDGRFMFVNEMSRLGADIRTDGHHAVVRGKEQLSGAPVTATDIRAGAGLVLAGLCAEGVTEVSHIHHIDRGYPDFVTQLADLGAKVERVRVPDDSFSL